MPYVITEPCIATKDTGCTEVCPVDCIHPRPDEPGFASADMLHIDPGACIDCGLCVDECPVRAIYPDHAVPAEWQRFVQLNVGYFQER